MPDTTTSTGQDGPDLHLLSGAYALDALPAEERARFEQHLGVCEPCRTEVADFAEAVDRLAVVAELPVPPGLRRQVLAQVHATRQDPPPAVRPGEQADAQPAREPGEQPATAAPAGPGRTPDELAGRRALRSARRALAGVAAAAVLAVGVLGGLAWQQAQSARSAQARAQAIVQVVSDPQRVERSARLSTGGTARVIAAEGKAVVALDGVPAAPPGRTYQLWVIGPQAIRSAGLIDVTSGSAQALVPALGQGTSLAVSVEPARGSQQPTTKPVVDVPVT